MNPTHSVAWSPLGDGRAGTIVMNSDKSHASVRLSITAAAAGFLFSFRTILVLISARWLNRGTEPGVIAGLLAELILLLLIALQTIGPASQQMGWVLRLPSLRWVMLFVGFSGCSLLWSATVSPLASSVYWGAMAADVAVVSLLLRTAAAAVVAHSMMKGYIAATILLSIVAWMMPVESDLRLGDLDYFNTNQIGNLCAMGVYLSQFLRRRDDGRWRFAALFLSLTLLRSLSKSTLIAFVVSQAVLMLSDKSITGATKVLRCLMAVVVLSIFGGLLFAYINLYATSGNQAQTLTGRTGIWLYCLNAGLERPLIGNGIDSLWKVAPPFGPELFEARHAENEILQQFHSYGLAGVVLLVGIYSSFYKSIRRFRTDSSWAVLGSLLLFILIRGLAEAEPFDLLLPCWMITLISTYAGAETLTARMLEVIAVQSRKE